MPHPAFRKLLVIVAALGSMAGLSSCGSSVSVASLQPTLSFQLVDGGRVATQSGEPVPSFAFQPRPRIDLGAGWRFEPSDLNPALTFATRTSQGVRDLEKEAAGRQKAGFDDSVWQPVDVPGSTSPPPGGHATDGWYRDTFTAPADWSGQAVTLKFGSVNYIADVWLNSTYLGYHEGGVTPFAFSTGKALVTGANTIAVRVYDPPKGARIDVLPWYYNDAWEYEGITGPVWLEAANPLHVVRADVVPYLDAADVSVVLQNSSEASYSNVSLEVEVLPAAVTTTNLLDPNPLNLIPKDAQTIATQSIDGISLDAKAVVMREGSFVFSGADRWTILHPALYVLGVHVLSNGVLLDSFYDTFGLRRIQVDPTAPRLLLNGEPIAFTGVAVQDERVAPAVNGAPRGGTPGAPEDELRIVRQAQSVNADLLRTNHVPGNPVLLMLADRLGLGVWEEIPMNHFTPETFTYVMQRGIAQQMLAEMDLRDFNRPSVMFHAFANESTGVSERVSAMQTLRDLDRKIDGTRLTGQAMYGSDPTDPTSSPLDVAGYTFYYGVFYGGRSPEPGTLRALQEAHRTYPHKPVMVLEFGQWVYDDGYNGQQTTVFAKTWPALRANLDTAENGYVGAAVWWSLNDYWSDVAGIGVEEFGLYTPDGTMRPVGRLAQSSFGEVTRPTGAVPGFTSGGAGAPEPVPEPTHIFLHLGYAVLFPVVLVAVLVAVMATARRSRRLRGAT